jgi:hypothetical protein
VNERDTYTQYRSLGEKRYVEIEVEILRKTKGYLDDRKCRELEFLNNLWGLGTVIGIGFSYRPARLHRLAEFIPSNRFLSSVNV